MKSHDIEADDLWALQERIKYRFKDVTLLMEALTHPSFANENPSASDNQRMEFLGDAILGAVIASELFDAYPREGEGSLTIRLSKIVREEALEASARRIGLVAMLRLGVGAEKGGDRERPAVLADAYEALVAAIYLDGGFEAARAFVLLDQQETLATLELGRKSLDAKSELQILLQRRDGELPHYEIIDESGPAHERFFTAEVRMQGQVLGRGGGRSKKEAESAAAQDALARFSHSE